ncbi:MAG: PP2C family protein-serine/threonine phosphatase [Planctomycetota bacterium]
MSTPAPEKRSQPAAATPADPADPGGPGGPGDAPAPSTPPAGTSQANATAPRKSTRIKGIASERQLSDLSDILKISRELVVEKDLDRLLQLIVAAITRILDAERSSLFIVEPEKNEMYTRIAQGDGVGTIRIPLGLGIAGSVAVAGKTVNIPDAYADARFNPEVDKRTGFRTRSILCMPLRDHTDRIVAVAQVLNKKSGRPFNHYDEYILDALGAQAGVVLEQARLRDIFLEQKRMQAEMDLAASIQRRLLPAASPTLPGLEVAGYYKASSETGGDYYDYLVTVDGDGPRPLGVLIGDVTGHGVGAAMIMTAARAMVRSLAQAGHPPDRVLTLTNNMLERDLEEGKFLSLCYGVFGPGGRQFSYTSAGHEPPLIFRPGEQAWMELESTGLLLGLIRDMEFPLAGPFDLQAGDIFVFFTDGLFEAMNAAEETYGMDRMKAQVETHADDSAQALSERLLASVNAFTGGLPQRDDVTLVVVKIV